MTDTTPPVAPSVEEIEHHRTAVRVARRYAFGAVLLSFIGNGVHLISKLTERSAELAVDSAAEVATIPELAAEAAIGPMVVLISTHLLLHSVRKITLETGALWVGALGGFILSSVHLYGIGAAVGLGMAAVLLPLATESAAVGSVLQYIRQRGELSDALAAVVIADRWETERAHRVEIERREAAELASIEADRATTEAAEAERLAAEAKTKRETKAAEALGNGAAALASVKADGKPKRGESSAAVAAYLAGNPDATQSEIADALNLDRKTVGRSDAWKVAKADREAAEAATGPELIELPAEPEPTELVGAASMNGHHHA